MAVFVYSEQISLQIYENLSQSEYNSQFEQKPQCLNLNIREKKCYILGCF